MIDQEVAKKYRRKVTLWITFGVIVAIASLALTIWMIMNM
jgi:hypothetical protein